MNESTFKYNDSSAKSKKVTGSDIARTAWDLKCDCAFSVLWDVEKTTVSGSLHQIQNLVAGPAP
ncbi:J domain-containing protein [Psidium guajava]|nr:J domain-containing protein [Psidium guajava]